VATDLDVGASQSAGFDHNFLCAISRPDGKQLRWKQLIELSVNLKHSPSGEWSSAECVEPTLSGEMRERLQLEHSLSAITAEVTPNCSMKVHEINLVPLNPVAVDAVHGCHEVCDGVDHQRRKG
jgi:hypothetical protein